MESPFSKWAKMCMVVVVVVGGGGLEQGNQEFCFGFVKSKMPFRHPRGDVQKAGVDQNLDFRERMGLGLLLDSHGVQVTLKVQSEEESFSFSREQKEIQEANSPRTKLQVCKGRPRMSVR